jgi:hypothetical protein
MKQDSLFARRSAFLAGLLAAGSVLALTSAANAACTPSAGDDVCDVTSATNPPANADFAAAGNDKLSLGGATNFTFDLTQIGAGLLGLDAFEKVGASEVTLTGSPTGANAANAWTVKAGKLIAAAGANFQNTANVSIEAGAELIVRTTNETINSLTNAGKLTVETGARLITGGNMTVQTGSELTGRFTVGGELINNGIVDGQGTPNLGLGIGTPSVITGNATNNAGGVLGGNLRIGGNLTNNGTLRPGESPGTIDVLGNYIGGGTIDAEVGFNNASLPVGGLTHDVLSIVGTVSGTTTINVIPFAPSDNPDPTTGDGVQLIRTASGAAANAFRLSGPVLQGGFQYLLTQVAGANPGFNLQSAVREELHANAVALAASRTTVRALAFADRGVEAAEGIGAKIRAWLTVHGGTEQAGINTGTRFNSNYWGVTGGVDTGFTSNVRVGVQGGYGQTDADIFLRQGSPTLEGETWFGQVYAQFVSGQWFADISAGYASTEWDMRRVVLGGRVSETVDGVIGKVGGGYRFQFDEPFAVTVQAHAIYDGSSCSDNCFLTGNREETSDWFGKASVRFERPYNDGTLRPYLQVSYTDDFDDGARIQFGQAQAFSDTSSSILGVNAGVAMDLAPNMHVYFDAGLTQGLDNDVQGYQGQAGFRMTW